MATTTSPKTKVVIVGAGFGGIRAARRLGRHRELDVTLISSEPVFSYYPQLYHSATGGSRSESALPLADLLAGLPLKLVQDTITAVDPAARTVSSAATTYQYDELILALGSVTNYFGIAGLPEFSYDIKSPAGAERFKRHLHSQLITDHRTDLNYVIVGGGPTGVELAAALGDYLHYITRKHGALKPEYKIDLVEAAPRLLPRSPEALSARVQRRLERLGVNVMTGQTVKAETADALQLGNESITSKTVVWTAGVANNPFFKANAQHFNLAKNGRVVVDDHMQSSPHVYVIGDNAASAHGGLAEIAVADADFAAGDLLRAHRRAARPAYHQPVPASAIPVGEHWAVMEYHGLAVYGRLGFIGRRLGDLVGYADVESWPKALKVWLQDSRREDDCPICSPSRP